MPMSASDYSKEVFEWTESLKAHQISSWKQQMEQWHILALGFMSVMSQQNETITNRQIPNGQTPTTNARQTPLVVTEYKIPSLWKRFVAGLIDFLLSEAFQNGFSLLCEKSGLFSKQAWIVLVINYSIDCMLYIVFSTGAFGLHSPGKRLLGLKILSCHEEVSFLSPIQVRIYPAQYLHFQTAVIRWFFRTLYWFFPFFLIVAFPNNLSMHDYFSSSIVVESL
ncbi:protein FAM8A1 [Lepeophtheirus salmonis]|uniref:protein FAM8A1 n=1 Tax=Lepeophtheirus salmonis TaxID=72036 RepID=UPI003AF3561A